MAEASGGMVVSAHPLASAAGQRILRAGGNATDAAIATQFALAVVCPRAGNLGGGGFWVYAPADDQVRTIDYRERAPAAATRDMYLDDDGEVHPTRSLLGPLAAGIPGTVDGLWLAYGFASQLRDWRVLLVPAIELAREGFRITAAEAERLNRYREDFVEVNDFDFPFVKDEPWEAGDRLTQPKLAKTLASLAADGPGYFYEGAFAQAMAAEVTERGGLWTADDLADYGAVWRDPIVTEYRGRTVYSMPPPSSGGVVLAQTLGLLEPYDLAALARRDSVAYYHLLVEAMRRAYEDRATYLGDPDFVAVPVDSLLDGDYLAAKWADFSPDSASSSRSSVTAPTKEVYETTHTSVVDALGNAVSVTTTLNNEMDDFSAKPGVPNQFGLIGGEANAIAPAKRMLSSMTPTIVREGGETILTLGSPGGSTIITAVLQVILNDLQHGMPLPKAIARPRIHHQWVPDVILYEGGGLSAEVRDGLRAKGHELESVESLGRVKAISSSGGVLIGSGDARNPDDSAAGLD